ncbi:MAG: hypothetical protein ACI83O_000676 [Patescibacteria group bacterium]|jgi:hypothetical protein
MPIHQNEKYAVKCVYRLIPEDDSLSGFLKIDTEKIIPGRSQVRKTLDNVSFPITLHREGGLEVNQSGYYIGTSDSLVEYFERYTAAQIVIDGNYNGRNKQEATSKNGSAKYLVPLETYKLTANKESFLPFIYNGLLEKRHTLDLNLMEFTIGYMSSQLGARMLNPFPFTFTDVVKERGSFYGGSFRFITSGSMNLPESKIWEIPLDELSEDMKEYWKT